ncbi:hypothetical protein T439DRAFT_139574 [Meredithblackwellia eburnea MCA 4105]
MFDSYVKGADYRAARALPKTDPARWFGRSMLALSLVSKDFAELCRSHIYQVIQSRRCFNPTFTYGVLYRHTHVVERVSFGGPLDRHVHVEGADGNDGNNPYAWDWQDTKSNLRAFDFLPLFPNLRELEVGTTAAAILFGLEDEQNTDSSSNFLRLPSTWQTLPPSATEECNDRRAALILLAPRISSLTIHHSNDERAEYRKTSENRVALPTLVLMVPLFASNLSTLRFNFNREPFNYDHSISISQCVQLKNLYLINMDARNLEDTIFEPLLRPRQVSRETGLRLSVPPLKLLFIDGLSGVYPLKLIRVFRRTLEQLYLNPYRRRDADIATWPPDLGFVVLPTKHEIEEERRHDEVIATPRYPALKTLRVSVPAESVPELFDERLGDVSGTLKDIVLDFYHAKCGGIGGITSRETIISTCKILRKAAPLARIIIKLDPTCQTETRELVHHAILAADEGIEPPDRRAPWQEWFSRVDMNSWEIGDESVSDSMLDAVSGEMRKQLDWVTAKLAKAKLAKDRNGVREVAQWMGKINSRFMWEMD